MTLVLMAALLVAMIGAATIALLVIGEILIAASVWFLGMLAVCARLYWIANR